MPTAGVGIGILEIARMERTLKRRPSFAARTFTADEQRDCKRMARPTEHYAARFAARVAVLKALGCSWGEGAGRHDVSVRLDADGRPVAVLSGIVKEAAEARGVTEVALSLSFTHEVATAMALLVTDEVKPQPKEERDPQRELLQSFRQARSVIDELERLQGDVAATLEGPTRPPESA